MLERTRTSALIAASAAAVALVLMCAGSARAQDDRDDLADESPRIELQRPPAPGDRRPPRGPDDRPPRDRYRPDHRPPFAGPGGPRPPFAERSPQHMAHRIEGLERKLDEVLAELRQLRRETHAGPQQGPQHGPPRYGADHRGPRPPFAGPRGPQDRPDKEWDSPRGEERPRIQRPDIEKPNFDPPRRRPDLRRNENRPPEGRETRDDDF